MLEAIFWLRKYIRCIINPSNIFQIQHLFCFPIKWSQPACTKNFGKSGQTSVPIWTRKNHRTAFSYGAHFFFNCHPDRKRLHTNFPKKKKNVEESTLISECKLEPCINRQQKMNMLTKREKTASQVHCSQTLNRKNVAQTKVSKSLRIVQVGIVEDLRFCL